jgi:hypothetical protein
MTPQEENHLYCTYELKNGELCGKKVVNGEHCKIHLSQKESNDFNGNWDEPLQEIKKGLDV